MITACPCVEARMNPKKSPGDSTAGLDHVTTTCECTCRPWMEAGEAEDKKKQTRERQCALLVSIVSGSLATDSF